MRILIIEDDEDIADLLRQGLERAGHRPVLAADGGTGYDLATEEPFALILLDWMLPDADGAALCQRLRSARVTTPILMLTARDTLRDRVRGLDAGADDYLTKPFEFEELLARVRALLRRNRQHKARQIVIADLEIDTGRRRVTRASQEVRLTPREYELLEALAAHQGQTLTRDSDLQSDLNADSLSLVSLVFAIEEEFGFESTELGSLVTESRTLGDLVAAVENRASNCGGGSSHARRCRCS